MKRWITGALSALAVVAGGLVATTAVDAADPPPAQAAPGVCVGKKLDKFHTRSTDTTYQWINWTQRIPPVGAAKIKNAETIGYRWCPTLVGNKWIGPGRVKIMWTKMCYSHYKATGPLAETGANPTQSPYFDSVVYDTTYFDNFEDNWVAPLEVKKVDNKGSQACSDFRRIPYAEREWIYVGDVGMAGYTTALTIHQDLQQKTDDYIRTANGMGSEVAWFAPSGDPTLATYAPGQAEPVTDPVISSSIGQIPDAGTLTWVPPTPGTCSEGYVWNYATNACVPMPSAPYTGPCALDTGPGTAYPCTPPRSDCIVGTGTGGVPCTPLPYPCDDPATTGWIEIDLYPNTPGCQTEWVG